MTKNMATKAKESAKGEIKKVVATTESAKSEIKKEVKKTVKKAAPKKEVVKKAVVKKTPKVTESAEVASVQNTETRNDEAEVSKKKVTKAVKAVSKKEVKTGTTIEELFEAGAHFGHVVKKWNPKMKKYLWGAKNGIHIFDLEKTMAGLDEAVKALTQMAAEGKRFVLVGTKRQVRQMVEEEAKRLEVPYITQRWMGGLITNWRQLKQTLDRLASQKQKRETGQLKKYTKKEQLMFDKEITRLERIIGGISSLKEAPEAVVVFDTHKEKLAVKEAHSRGLTVIGMVDSNANPDVVDIVIPMNDDSAKGLEIVVKILGQAIENGLKVRKENSK